MPEPAAASTADQRTVTVVGEGLASAVPDAALLQLGVETAGRHPPGALEACRRPLGGHRCGGLAGLYGMLALGLSRKSRLPFGPWLLTGALLGVLVGREITAWLEAAIFGAT